LAAALAVVRGFFVVGRSMNSSSSSDNSCTTLFLPAVREVVVASKSISISSSLGIFFPLARAVVVEVGWETTLSGAELKNSSSGFVGAVVLAVVAIRSATLAASFSLIFPISSSRFFSSTLLLTKFYHTHISENSRSISLKGAVRWRWVHRHVP